MPRVLLLEPLADVASTSFCCCVASAEPPSARVSSEPVNKQDERKIRVPVHTGNNREHTPTWVASAREGAV